MNSRTISNVLLMTLLCTLSKAATCFGQFDLYWRQTASTSFFNRFNWALEPGGGTGYGPPGKSDNVWISGGATITSMNGGIVDGIWCIDNVPKQIVLSANGGTFSAFKFFNEGANSSFTMLGAFQFDDFLNVGFANFDIGNGSSMLVNSQLTNAQLNLSGGFVESVGWVGHGISTIENGAIVDVGTNSAAFLNSLVFVDGQNSILKGGTLMIRTDGNVFVDNEAVIDFGTLDLSDGKIAISSGTLTVDGLSSVTNNGTLQIDGGTTNVSRLTFDASSELSLNGGSLNIRNDFATRGRLQKLSGLSTSGGSLNLISSDGFLGDTTIGDGGASSLSLRANSILNTEITQLAVNGGNFVGTIDPSNTWNATEMFVGYSGNAGLNVRGTLETTFGRVGGYDGGIGSVTVSGGIWNSSSQIAVGFGGGSNGTLSISSGGTVNTFRVILGQSASPTPSHGIVSVSGASSSLNVSAALIGNYGAADLTVRNSGQFNSDIVDMAYNAGSTSSVTIENAGSQWTNTDWMHLATQGVGDLNILNGGQVSTKTFQAGINVGSSGSVLIDGVGSNMQVAGAAEFGSFGSADLTISNGGSLSTTHGYVGGDVGGNGSVNVDGGSWNSSTILIVGYGAGSMGDMTIQGGGNVSTYQFVAGHGSSPSHAYGTTLITGAGSSLNIHSSGIGNYGTGLVAIESGGAFHSDIVDVGFASGSHGTVNIDGNGSQWQNSDWISVGTSGTGVLNVSNGGQLITGTLRAGMNSAGNGLITISGPDSWAQISGNLDVGILGTGRLDVLGGTVEVGGTTSIGSNGTIHLAGGTLKTSVLDLSSGTFEMLGGRLNADSITGNLSMTGGTLAAGDSPGLTLIDGNLDLLGGEIEVEIAGLVPELEYDVYHVTGDVTLSGGLQTTLLNGYSFQLGQQFQFLQVDGTLNGAFVGLSEGDLVLQNGQLGLFITYQGGDGNDVSFYVSAVPEPNALIYGI
ncbi:MAG: hypothetical protein R3C03_09570 [Pirellulaceae bacterium]